MTGDRLTLDGGDELPALGTEWTFPDSLSRQQRTPATEGQVYRIYDGADRLLYVGCSVNGFRRMIDHAHRDWWPEVRKVTYGEILPRAEAMAAETAAIQAEHPRHNVIHNPTQA